MALTALKSINGLERMKRYDFEVTINSIVKIPYYPYFSSKLRIESMNTNTDAFSVLSPVCTSLSLGIEDVNGYMCIIVHRNQTLPFRTQFYPVFTNAYAYQTTAAIRIFSGEHKLTKYNVS